MNPVINLVVNGVSRQADEPVTIRDLLPDPRGHAVAVNGDVVPARDHDRPLVDGDRVEIVTAVQGG
ncbi:sulfur carrier protein ThiS [Nocardioides sp. InS609-2]|uniref:sulfur carrier protein ThiS n=1 Tax=Nocardioides sp. InS609-2 TaxID=2760705 RepID=UPI0020BEDCDA|nr:sulfur carrier protein ThiS [Nocardioides sp. InS609-2]